MRIERRVGDMLIMPSSKNTGGQLEGSTVVFGANVIFLLLTRLMLNLRGKWLLGGDLWYLWPFGGRLGHAFNAVTHV